MSHIILLGDSIFDNAAYVAPGRAVIDTLRRRLPANWKATLLARDGSVVRDVGLQLDIVTADATHLVISCGGNNALGQLGLLQQTVTNIFGALQHLTKIQSAFDVDYRWLLVVATGKAAHIAVCTIYDSIPGMEREVLTTLALFNDVISRRAIERGLPLLDFRLLLNEADDYSRISPIEPSARGSEKIAAAMCSLLHTEEQCVTNARVLGGMRT